MSTTSTMAIILIIGIGGLIETRNEKNDRTKSRSAASVLSLIPGIGHIYLNSRQKGYLLLTCLVMGVIVYGTTTIIDRSTPGSDVAYAISMYSLLFLFTILIWSIFDISALCDEKKLDTTIENEYFELNFKNPEILSTATIIISYILFLALASGMIIINFTESPSIHIAVIILSSMISIYVLTKFHMKKKQLASDI